MQTRLNTCALSKLNKPDMQDIAVEVDKTYYCGHLQMDEQRLQNQLERIYNSPVPIQDVALWTFREQWTVDKGGERGSWRSVLAARNNDNDDFFSRLVWFLCLMVYQCL